MTRCDGRVRAGVFDLDARLAKVRSPPANFDPLFSYFNSRAPTAAIFHLPVATRCSPRSGLSNEPSLARAPIRLPSLTPPKRLTSPMPFICNKFDLTPVQSQVRTNKHICTQPHPQAHTQTCTPTRHANTRMHKRERTEKHADAQTQHTRHTHAHTHVHGHERHNGGTQQMPTHTHKHALKHDMHSNTPATTFKIQVSNTTTQAPHTNTHRHAHAGWGGGLSLWLDARGHACAFVCVCVCAFAFTLLCHTHTHKHDLMKKTRLLGGLL